MRLGYLCLPERGRTDTCLGAVVRAAQDRGLLVAGLVQDGGRAAGAHPCDMALRVLPDGPVLRLAQNLGRGARGCRMDPAVLERAALAVEARLDGAALLVVNRFGKQDASGRGMVPAISAALGLGVPVLIGVSPMNLPAFLDFAAGLALPLPPDPAAMLDWALQTRAAEVAA
jgi:hypothetical protein